MMKFEEEIRQESSLAVSTSSPLNFTYVAAIRNHSDLKSTLVKNGRQNSHFFNVVKVTGQVGEMSVPHSGPPGLASEDIAIASLC